MIIKSKKGNYELLTIFKNSFDLEKFEEAYIEECFDKYPYIVGDISDGILRLKGFSVDSKKSNYYKNIDTYISKSCAFEAPYYILRRIKNPVELETLKDKEPNVIAIPNRETLEKENFDKDSLILESSIKNKPNIVLNIERINNISIGQLPQELRNSDDKEENITTVVSSDGFVPIKREHHHTHKKRKRVNK